MQYFKRKTRWLFQYCLSLGFCITVSTPALATKPILNIAHWKTSNGASVYFVRRPEIPMVDIQLVFAAGSAYDGQQWGIANFVNNMLDQGTQQYNANQIATTFDAAGATFGGSVNRDMAVVSLRSVTDSQYLEPALHYFETALTQSSFPENAFQRVKKQTEAAIQQSQQQPMAVAANAFYQALYGRAPYGHPVIGTTHSIRNLSREKALNFYHRYYVAENADLIIVGDLTSAKAKNIAEALTKGLPTGKAAATLSAAADNQPAKKNIPFPAKQNSIIQGQVAASRDNADYFPLVVGNQILGGGTMTSLLFNQVRNDRGLVYGVSSQLGWLRYRGPFAIVLQTRSEKTDEALAVTDTVLKTFIKNGPTDEQLKAAQRNIIGSFPLQISKNSQIEALVTRLAFYHLPLDYLDTYRNNINAVTAKQIQQAFAKWIKPQSMATVVVGSAS